METLGLIETKGFLSAIVAADAAVKSANVTIIRAEKIKGGYVTVQLVGDVGAVKAAVDTAGEAIESFGTLVSHHVIPRMHTETTQLIYPKEEEKDLASQTEETKQLSTLGEEEEELVEEHTTEEKQVKETKPLNQKELEQMTVPELRKLVLERNVEKGNTNTMKYAKKAELVNRLLNKENKK